MTGPKGNSEFCSPSTSVTRLREHWGSRGNKTQCFPSAPVIKCLIMQKLSTLQFPSFQRYRDVTSLHITSILYGIQAILDIHVASRRISPVLILRLTSFKTFKVALWARHVLRENHSSHHATFEVSWAWWRETWTPILNRSLADPKTKVTVDVGNVRTMLSVGETAQVPAEMNVMALMYYLNISRRWCYSHSSYR